ncbi:Major facilitator superfamily and Major facilitator superfamily domain, general substrate transporter-containing protein [Strongyloides ratti]|uniref:Major facilitator superfamily and Major facilitator superfamily domain, general substrate transporter-containing protein n=1 Tax=Strongyloides ratti TaxID=34506 RepID=A0A090KVX9_STRRB|nr:Major facilitator superfamily and Major facilitator superfamily domain, general substrate transporter-containing protein [Strongyloides ratti]CEF59422.1 Major facilitator superfamily and Major facilitator superfamily domain, general substrate transporter-containing protein [Strongyloides ratti]
MNISRGSLSALLNNKIRHINFFFLIIVLSLMHGNLFFLNILYIKDLRIKEYYSSSISNNTYDIENVIERTKRNILTKDNLEEKGHPVSQDIYNKSTFNDIIKNQPFNDTISTRRVILTKSTEKETVTIPTTTKEIEWIDGTEYIKNLTINNIEQNKNDLTINNKMDNNIIQSDTIFSYKIPTNFLKSFLETLFFASPGIGMLVGLFPMTKFVYKYGIQRTLTTCGIINGCCMAFIPIIIDMKIYYLLIAIRLIQGFFTSSTFSIIGSHIVNWESVGDQTSSLNIGIVSSVIGPIITWPLVIFCENPSSIGYTHYLLSSLIIIFTGVFYIFYRNDPTKHPWIRGQEIIKIRSCKILSQKIDKAKIFSQIIMCLDTWILVISSMAYFVLVSFGLTYLPFFISLTLKYSFIKTVIYSVVPLIFLFLSHGLMSAINYFINNSNNLIQSKICNSLAYFTSAAFLSSIIFLTPEMGIKYLSYLLIVLSFIPLGFVCFGFLQCTTSVGKHYGQYIVAMYQISFSISLSFIPFLVTFTTKYNDIFEWKFFFLHLSVLFLICNIVYIFLAEIEPLQFAEESWLDDLKHQNGQEMRLIGLDEEYGIVEMKEIQ